MNLELVDCSQEYWEFVRLLRTNPENQEGFFTYAEITSEQQKSYMSINSKLYKICLADNLPAGYVGLINGNEITYCVDPKFQGKGIGTFMVKEFSNTFGSIGAYVKLENIASQKVFEKLGWEKQIYYKWNKK